MGELTLPMRLIQSQLGRPLRSVIEDLYDQHRQIAPIARHFGVSRQTIYDWLARMNICVADLEARATELDTEREKARWGIT